MRIIFVTMMCLYVIATAEALAGFCGSKPKIPLDSVEELVRFAPPVWREASAPQNGGDDSCWQPSARADAPLHPLTSGVRVFRGHEPDSSSLVYLAFVDWRLADVEVRIAPTLLETSRLTKDCVLGLNGGYFSGHKSMSLLVHRGQILAEDAQGLRRLGGFAYPSRGALSFDFWTGRPDFLWASVVNKRLLSYPWPVDPFSMERETGRAHGRSFEALGAGPMLLYAGVMVDTFALEAFDEGIRPGSPSPRTAVATLPGGGLVFLVVDGRSKASRGMSLEQLAYFLQRLDAHAALNLDGGGSSTLATFGHVLNEPSGAQERPIKSALCISKRSQEP